MKIAELINQQVDNRLYREDESLVSNRDGVGVELELENIVFFSNGSLNTGSYLRNLPLPNLYWTPVEDGSLREGTEFTFKGAMIGANITAALEEMEVFLNVFRRNGKPVEITERCSVHVHLDVREMDESGLNNLILIYLLVERVIFQHVNPLRLKNNYCRPLSDSSFKYTLSEMMQYSKRKSLPSLSQVVKRDCDKYSALNVLPITKFGSVEFRHHHGTSDMLAIKDWINVILSLKVASYTYKIEDLLEIYEKRGAVELLSVIFKGSKLGSLEHIVSLNIDEMMSKGVSDIKEILNMESLQSLNSSRNKSRAKTENTLLHQFKEVNNLSTFEVSPEFNDLNIVSSVEPVTQSIPTAPTTSSEIDAFFNQMSLGA